MALTVAALFASGKVSAAEEKKGDDAGKVKCQGINACKGKGACHSKENACAGKNGCKGKGWTNVQTEKECTDKGGKVVKG